MRSLHIVTAHSLPDSSGPGEVGRRHPFVHAISAAAVSHAIETASNFTPGVGDRILPNSFLRLRVCIVIMVKTHTQSCRKSLRPTSWWQPEAPIESWERGPGRLGGEEPQGQPLTNKTDHALRQRSGQLASARRGSRGRSQRPQIIVDMNYKLALRSLLEWTSHNDNIRAVVLTGSADAAVTIHSHMGTSNFMSATPGHSRSTIPGGLTSAQCLLSSV